MGHYKGRQHTMRKRDDDDDQNDAERTPGGWMDGCVEMSVRFTASL